MAIFKRGNVYWYEFVFDGRRIRRSTKQGNRKAAVDIESAYRTALAKGEVGIVEPKKERRTIGQLLDLLSEDYEHRRKLSSQNISLIAKTRRIFGAKLAAELTEEDVTAYVRRQEKAGDRPATINRVTQMLHKSFAFGKVEPPDMLWLSEKDNARTGFFDAKQMALILANLPHDGLRDYVDFAYQCGMRKGEAESLRWENVDDGSIVLRGEDAKTGDPRKIPIEGELADIMKRRAEARRIKTDSGFRLSEFIFHRGDGKPIGEFRKSWKTACIAAGLGKWVCEKCETELAEKRCPHCKTERTYVGKIFHDLRRTAVRDMLRAGNSQKVAMEISGHKTISVFDRYNIIDDRDRREALRSTQRYREEQRKAVVSVKG